MDVVEAINQRCERLERENRQLRIENKTLLDKVDALEKHIRVQNVKPIFTGSGCGRGRVQKVMR